MVVRKHGQELLAHYAQLCERTPNGHSRVAVVPLQERLNRAQRLAPVPPLAVAHLAAAEDGVRRLARGVELLHRPADVGARVKELHQVAAQCRIVGEFAVVEVGVHLAFKWARAQGSL